MQRGQPEPLGVPPQGGDLVTWLLAPGKAPRNFRNWCYLRGSLARPSARAHQPHPGSTFGVIRGTYRQAGSGEGLAALA